MRILLHACCAPCSVYCIERLRQMNMELDVYWYNPNIHPYIEYKTRRDTLIEYTKTINIKSIINENYGLDEFTKNVINDLKNRCQNYCYRIRLEETAKYAKEHNYDAFSTTLLISPYQKHDLLMQIGEEIGKKYDISFFYEDFRIGFRQGQAKARELGLYMQKYCGCIFSEESRYNNPNPPKPELPTGCEYQSRRTICVKKIENKNDYLDLLLDADPSKASIDKYLSDSDVYGLQVEENIVSLAVILHIDKNTLELKNLVTKKEYRGKGYAKKLLKSLCGNYKQKYNKMLVGTSENNIPFYVKQGFDKYEKTIKNYFIDNYDEEIIDRDLQCIDMYYYSKDLKKAKKEM